MRFVIHNHHASHHHYDLRIEVPATKGMLNLYNKKRQTATPEPLPQEEGETVLLSFAIPKHDIPKGNKKLLAVMTEPHPSSYLDFAKGKQETIPEGSYGAGKMDMVDSGNIEYIKETPDLLKFKLSGKEVNGTYSLIRAHGNQWLWVESNDNKKESKVIFAAQDCEDYLLDVKRCITTQEEYDELLKNFEFPY